MPTTIIDVSDNTYDLTVPVPAAFTEVPGVAPNGDGAMTVSQAAATDTAEWSADSTFSLPASGTWARTLLAWVNLTAGAASKTIAACRTNSFSTSGANRHWQVLINASEVLEPSWFNNAAGVYAGGGLGGVISPGWHLLAVIFRSSGTYMEAWVDGVFYGSDATVSGTPTTAATGSYILYVGMNRTDANNEMTDQMCHVSWFERALTGTEILDLYQAMTAT